MKTLEATLAELESTIKAAPYTSPGAPPPKLDVAEVRQEIERDRDGRITKILVTNADNSVTRKIIERDADHRIRRVTESTSPPFITRASPTKRATTIATATDDVGTTGLLEGLRKRSAELRAEDRARVKKAKDDALVDEFLRVRGGGRLIRAFGSRKAKAVLKCLAGPPDR